MIVRNFLVLEHLVKKDGNINKNIHKFLCIRPTFQLKENNESDNEIERII